jgi:hypothetical protein
VPGRPLVVYCHIPKAGGTTLSTILTSEYTRVQPIYSDDDRRRFAQLSASEQAELELLYGHFSFGLHARVVVPRSEGEARPFTYITVMRDPVERVASHYYHVIRDPTHYLHAAVTGRQLSLAEFLRCEEAWLETHDGQVNPLCGEVTCVVPEDLVRARDNIRRHFAVVGIVEQFDASLLLMRRRLGWRRVPLYTRQNVGTQPTTRGALGPELVAVIEAQNPLDMALYRFALARLRRQMLLAGPGYFLEWRRFRLANARFQQKA